MTFRFWIQEGSGYGYAKITSEVTFGFQFVGKFGKGLLINMAATYGVPSSGRLDPSKQIPAPSSSSGSCAAFLQRWSATHKADLGSLCRLFLTQSRNAGSRRSQKPGCWTWYVRQFSTFFNSNRQFRQFTTFLTGAVTLSCRTAELILSPMVIKVPRSAGARVTGGKYLFDRQRTGDEDIHQSPCALLPVRTGRDV